ncbi:dephospho-CoA kinase [Anaerobranca gottschalkii]|uniref:Dephospho-CoA kinase n=1 Tax=Anaerobranca gottschalkii DSM 13577 TaxID=1120990 RepID=A0A1H9Z358_9FIRM|nr:dephospho-CoA kinase [Anaerobranca gottschalkii]SES75947.1 dephospho-CoA kinase [Anaerobranca gottschalkii DSM 13577]
MKKIGLTGGIASGKSTISKILKRLGAAIIDADLEAKATLKPETKCWELLVKEFGREILKPDNTIDRKKLGNLVFGKAEKLQKLNQIVHPFVKERIKNKMVEIERKGKYKAIVLDAPLLIETGFHNLVDEVWVVDVDRETQIQRVMKRDNLNREQAIARINSQLPREERIKYATAIIDNMGTRKHTREQIIKLWQTKVEEK